MALNVSCPNGHSYIASDIYIVCKGYENAPRCPVCLKEWLKKKRKKRVKKKS